MLSEKAPSQSVFLFGPVESGEHVILHPLQAVKEELCVIAVPQRLQLCGILVLPVEQHLEVLANLANWQTAVMGSWPSLPASAGFSPAASKSTWQTWQTGKLRSWEVCQVCRPRPAPRRQRPGPGKVGKLANCGHGKFAKFAGVGRLLAGSAQVLAKLANWQTAVMGSLPSLPAFSAGSSPAASGAHFATLPSLPAFSAGPSPAAPGSWQSLRGTLCHFAKFAGLLGRLLAGSAQVLAKSPGHTLPLCQVCRPSRPASQYPSPPGKISGAHLAGLPSLPA